MSTPKPSHQSSNPLTQLTQVMVNLPAVKALRLRAKAKVPRLEIRKTGDRKTEVYDLVGDYYTIGRSSSKCDIVVQTPLISQVHAELVRDSTKRNSHFAIKDRDSTNGIFRCTWLSRQRLSAAPLRHNTTISLGPPELEDAVQLRFVDPPPWYLRTLQFAGLGVAGAIAILLGAIAVEYQKVPDVRPLPVSQQGPIEVLAGDGQTSIGPPERAQHSELSQIVEFGKHLPKAVIASEDTSFYWNLGVDPYGIARAFVTNLRSGELREGASTIAQQLARNVLVSYVGAEDSAGRKWREAVAAIKLTLNYGKDDLLSLYLNRVYLGYGVYGFHDAAKLYFNKSAGDLDLSEAATLAGILPAPNRINPFKNKKLALEYRDRILNRMADLGYITEQESEAARRSILRLNLDAKNKVQGTVAPYFYGYVFDELQDLLGERLTLEGGLIVETNLNLTMQKASDQTLRATIAGEGSANDFSQGAILTLDTRDGSILAMTGGVDFQKSQFNRAAQAQRQAGSTFKLFGYAAAIAKGISPHETFSCAPVAGIAGCSHGGSGAIDMYRGFALSENPVAVRVAQSAGLDKVIATARLLGVKSRLEATTNLVLGGYEVTVPEMAGAYAAIANQGLYNAPHAVRRVIDRRNCRKEGEALPAEYRWERLPKTLLSGAAAPNLCRVIFDAKQDLRSQQAIDPGTADTMLDLMAGVVQYGTGKAAALPRDRAVGKTGTTDAGRDLWFIGIVPQRRLLAAVWLGNDLGTTSGTSASAARLWGDYMTRALD